MTRLIVEDGEVIGPADILEHELSELREENDALRKRIGRLEVEKARLQREGVNRLESSQHFPEAREVLLFWQAQCSPQAREPLSPPRLRAAIERLKHRSVDELKRAVVGYSKFPYQGEYGRRMTEGRSEQRKVDADFIFRDDKHVLIGIELAERAESQGQAFANGTNGHHANGNGNGSLGPLGDMAVRLATMGWHVFPCVPDQKRPATPHGLLDATTDLERISSYWRRVPDANVAVRCGKQSGVVTLDQDGDAGLESLRGLETRFGPLPHTTSVVTPRGGSHFHFQHPGGEVRNTAGVLGPGLDTRGDGGYVLVPPSRVAGRPYEPDERVPLAPLPEWLLKAIVEYQARTARKIQSGEWAELMLQCTGQGQRNDLLTRIAGHLITRLPADEVLATLINANRANFKPPLSDREVEAVVSSIAGREARKPLRAR